MHELGQELRRGKRRGVSRTALVTGASGAFGTAVRGLLRERGWRVAGLDLRPDPADAEVLACDVTDDAAVPVAVAEAIERLGGRLDALVNNAGIGGPASAGEPPGDKVRAMLDVNLLGAWRVTAAAIDPLVESRGRVVLVASRMSFIGLPLGAAYGVSKRALVAYADALRAEYGTHVGVTCVHPAMVPHADPRLHARGGPPARGLLARGAPGGRGRGDRARLRGLPAGRDVAITRGGAVQLAVARHLPGVVDRIVARLLARRIAAGDLDDAPLADGLRTRHGR